VAGENGLIVLFLVPYLGVSGALQPLTPIIATQLHASEQTISIGYGLANAGYAVGTVLAVQLAQHLPQRRLTVAYAALLVNGSVLAATATGAPVFIVGHVLQGLCTSLLLIASTPPLILGYPVGKLRSTAVIRRSPTPPTITTPASSSSAPTARPGSAAGWRKASPQRSPPARSGRS
jgi:MFS family permease